MANKKFVEMRETLKAEMVEIENLFEKPKDGIDEGELSHYKSRYRLMRTIGIDIVKTLMREKDIRKVTVFCKEYVEKNREDAQWLMKKVGFGLPLVEDEKIELAKYHIALTFHSLFPM